MAEVIAPQTGSFIQITGDSANGLLVQNLTFRGLSFQHGQYRLPAAGVSLSQAVPTLPVVISLNGARNITFEDCEVAHIGQNAIGI